MDIKKKRKIIHLNINGCDFYYGSIVALYEQFDANILGIKKADLGKQFRNKYELLKIRTSTCNISLARLNTKTDVKIAPL